MNLMDKAVSFKGLTKINEILGILGENVSTSFKVEEMIALQNLARKISKDNIESIEMNVTNGTARIGSFNASIVQISEEERQRISKILREHLELDPPSSPEGSTPDSGIPDTPQGSGESQNSY